MKKILLGLVVPLTLLMFISSCEKEDDPFGGNPSGDITDPHIVLEDFDVLYHLDMISTPQLIDAEKVYINGVVTDETMMKSVRIRVISLQTFDVLFEKNIEGNGQEISFSEEWNATEIGQYRISINAYDTADNLSYKAEEVTYVN